MLAILWGCAMNPLTSFRSGLIVMVLLANSALIGCATNKPIVPADGVPRELKKSSLPDYVIEPPDVLLVDMVSAVPKPPYRVQPLDGLALKVLEAPPDNPIMGVYSVELDGTLNLGPFYGNVTVVGKTLAEVKADLEKLLVKVIKKPTVEVTLAQGRGLQQVRGPHLVRGDGTINLGTHGTVRVVGMNMTEAKQAIEAQLSAHFQSPEISLDIGGYNSKVYYVIFDTGGAGQPIQRFPITGNETVIDALSQVGGLMTSSDPKQIWIARPTDTGCPTTLPVDWRAITECADSRTNYQMMPGDRLFVRAYPLTAFAIVLDRVLFPFERILGVSLLGVGTLRTFENNNVNGGVGVIR
jgi:polysaccharide biosynthesis/export protein